jgi:hypothetical protein
MGKNGEHKSIQISENLHSDNITLVKSTINDLRSSGNSSHIPILIELLHSNDNSELKELIINLLNDLKHTEAIPKLIEAIRDNKYSEERQSLVSVCWENGMDFGSHLPLFVDLVIKEDFSVAFEAFTLIENMASKISDSIKNEQVQIIKDNLDGVPEDKAYLLNNLIEIIPNIKENECINSVLPH